MRYVRVRNDKMIENFSEKETLIFDFLLSALYYVRKKDKTVYMRELQDYLLLGEENDVVKFIKQLCGLELLCKKTRYKDNMPAEEVVTNRKYRMIIDLILDKFIDDKVETEKIQWNAFLYGKEEMQNDNYDLVNERLGYKSKLILEKTPRNEIVIFKIKLDDALNDEIKNKATNNIYCEIFWKLLQDIPHIELFKRYSERCEITSIAGDKYERVYFCEKDIVNVMQKSKCEFVDCFFDGELDLNEKVKCSSYDFTGSVFTKKITIENIKNLRKLNFRNAKICGNVEISDIIFQSDNYGTILSFEDAIFYGNICGVNIKQCVFCNANLNFFQCHLLSGSVHIYESDFYDSEILFDGACIKELGMVTIFNWPLCRFLFEKCDKLSLAKCEIKKACYIENVNEFIIEDTKRCGGNIISNSKWGDQEDIHKNDTPKRKERMPYILVNKIKQKIDIKTTHPLLESSNRSVENDRKKSDCARQFLMLKENFRELGEYDFEDESYILYMKTQDDCSYFRKALYSFLGLIGGYGLRPTRIFVSFIILIGMDSIYYKTYDNMKTWRMCVMDAFKNAISLDIAGCKNTFGIDAVNLISAYFGWFLMGYFSVAVIKKTLR